MANLIQGYEPVMAFGCSHGEYVNEPLYNQILTLTKVIKPVHRFHLGDLIDTAAFRGGAKGTGDEVKDVRLDFATGLRIIDEWKPTVFTMGNHDDRLIEAANHPNAIRAHAGRVLLNGLLEACNRHKTKVYYYKQGEAWHKAGGYAWGHGFAHGMNALQLTTANRCMPVVMVHTHRVQEFRGPYDHGKPSFNIGTTALARSLTYADRWEGKNAWAPGLVYGYIRKPGKAGKEDAKLWMLTGPQDGILDLPPGLA